MKIEHKNPEEKHISSEWILNFNKRIQKKGISLHSATLFVEDSIVSEIYYSPFKKDELHRMFSIAKTVVALCICVLSDEGKLSLDDHIVDYFPEKLPKIVHPYLAQMTIKDMLMMRTCHAQTTYNKFDMGSDWVGSFFTTAPTHKPGTVFHYDTSAPHVLSALVEKLTKKDTWTFFKESFKELEFSDASYMIKDGQGVSFGGSGLVATADDILKMGILLLNEGNVDGKQLISKEFVKAATSCLTPNAVAAPLPSESCGYGYYIWRTEKSGYVLYGMGGQLVIVCPKEKIILTTTADAQGYSGGNQIIYDAFYEEILEKYRNTLVNNGYEAKVANVQDSKDDIAELKRFAENAKINTVLSTVQNAYKPSSELSRSYSLDENPNGFKALRISLYKDYGEMILTACDDSKHTVTFGYEINKEGILPLYDDRTFGSGAYIAKDTFYICLRVVDERLGSVHFELYFEEYEITVYMKKIEETSFKEFNGHLHGFIRK
jgi:CubicO group peptidase (beta-lactamase class C family)